MHMEGRRFPWAATVVLGVFLLLAGGFSWKVFSFYRQIQNGTMDPGTYALSRTDTSQALAALVAQAQGSGALATDDDPSVGAGKDARITIVEFGDFGCPYTKAESLVVQALVRQFPDDVKVVYRDFPLEELHPGAELAAAGGVCAEAQGRFWEYHDAVFAANDLSEETIVEIADEIGLDTSDFVDCVNDVDTIAEYEQDLADGYAAEVRGTPTFFVNGEKIEGAVPYDLFKNIVEAFLRGDV